MPMEQCSDPQGKVKIVNPDRTGKLTTVVVMASNVTIRNFVIEGPSVLHENENELQDAIYVAVEQSNVSI